MSRSILHVHWTFPPTTGGVESHIADLARLQAVRGDRVTVVTGEPDPKVDHGYSVRSTPLLDLDLARKAAAAPQAHAAALVHLFEELLSETGADVVHGHNLHHFSPAPALAIDGLRSRLRFATHHTFHETWPDVLASQPVYRTWEGCYAISSHIRAMCEELIGFSPEVLHPSVDFERFRPTRPPFSGGATPRLLHPARLLPWKGVHVSVQALRLVLDMGLPVELVLTDTERIADWDGALPGYRREIVKLIEDLDLTDRVSFVAATFTEMPQLYNDADIVLYPTVRNEPFGLVPPEAMGCARPVVASRSGGIVESVEHGVTGFLVEEEDVEGLAESIAMLLRDPERANAMGEAGRLRARRLFCVQDYLDALEERYARPLRTGSMTARA